MQKFNENITRELLLKAGSIIEKYETIARETGANFNIFEIADINTKETTVCRVLTELLSSAGYHGQGGAYLGIFLRDCLKLNFTKDEIDNARVYSECPTDKGRRIDIVVEIGSRFIPIEVKIYAGEGIDQCYDYLQFARYNKSDKNAKVVYLTLEGHFPSEYSAKKLTEDDILTISFETDILNWLEKCVALPDTIRKAPIREILIQFASAIKRLTNQLEDKPKMEMLELLSASPQNMRSAKAIADVFENCREEKIKAFLSAVEKKLEDEPRLKRLTATEIFHNHDYSLFNTVKSFKGSGAKCVGINYIVGSDIKVSNEMYNILFRVELDFGGNNLIAGFGLAKNGERIGDRE